MDSWYVPVGTMVASMLDYSEFAREIAELGPFDPKKSKWCPADGRPVDGSKYAEYKKEHLPANTTISVPDIRGLFLRCVNMIDPQVPLRSDGFLDADNRKVGSLQKDDVVEHKHETPRNVIQSPPSKGRNAQWGKGAYDELFGYSDSDICNSTRPFGGSSETHPKNIAVSYYIRIN